MAGSDVPNFFNNDSDGEDDDFDFANTGRNGLIFMVDCSSSMFEAQDEGDESASNFMTILGCVEQTMKNLIITSANTLMGIVFYNVRHSPKPKMEVELLDNGTFVVPEKTAIFIPMTVLSADVIKYVKHIKESVDFFDFGNRYGHTDDCNFANALWLCSRLKSSCGYKLQSCKLMIFTDKNSPHEPGSHEFQQCFVRAKDLNQADVMCVLVPMVEAFNVDVFYKEFLCTALDCDVEELEQANPTRDIETLTKRIFRQDYRKRVNHHLRWQLGGDLALGVGVYSLTRKKFYMKKVKLQRDTNEVIVAKRSTLVTILDEHNQEEVETRRLQPGEAKKQLLIGDEHVTLSAEEYQNMRQMTQPGCRLLGFKPMSAVNPHLHAQSPLFLFADETLIKGSNKLFASLWKRCLAKERVAICLLTLRRSTWPKFVALVPQNEIHNADNDMVRPNGFRVEFLPSAEDIRKLTIFDGPSPLVTEEQLDLMKKITKKLRFRYSPSQFEEPTLIMRYTNIEAIVFESNRVSEIEDTTLPDREYQDSKIQQLVQEITEVFGEDLQIGGAKKRREPDGDGPKEKRGRNNNETQLDVLEAVRSGKGGSLTVAMLKQHLTALGCKNLAKMNKAELIQKVTETDPSF